MWNFLRPFPLEIEGQKSARNFAEFRNIFLLSFEIDRLKISPEFRSRGPVVYKHN